MEKGTHGKDEESFKKLTYAGQAKSLNAQIQVINKAFQSHFRKGKIESKDINSSKIKYRAQLLKIIEGLE